MITHDTTMQPESPLRVGKPVMAILASVREQDPRRETACRATLTKMVRGSYAVMTVSAFLLASVTNVRKDQ